MKRNLTYIIVGVVGVFLLGYFLIQNQQNISPTPSIQKEVGDITTNNQSPTECSGEPTTSLTEGPYYKSGSPEKTNLYESGIPGKKITITGYVFDTNCKPLANAWLDFWQANGDGEYDNVGYNLRGHQFTDQSGKFTLTTVAPGEYPGRTPHIHVKVRTNDNSPPLTTQLFFPGSSQNEADTIYDQSLLLNLDVSQRTATFNFVVETQ